MNRTEPYYHFLPFAILYFFGNNLLLPEGLLYTAILSPVLLYFIYREHDFANFLIWGILLLIPIPFHLIAGVEVRSYFISTALVVTVLIFLFAAKNSIQKINDQQENIFKSILIINSVLIIIAFLVLPFESIREVFWWEVPISPNVPGFPRLKLLAYEPSHYALLLSPVLLFYILKVLTGQTRHSLLIIGAVGFPLLISLSFGVVGALGLALIIGSLIYATKLPKIYGNYFLYSVLFFLVVIGITWLVWPENPVYIRITNIFTGTDTSARGRLFNSFWFAYDLIKEYNFLMGVGPGQVKILAHDMIVNYYQYYGSYAEIVRIPNSMGELLATYGLYGFLIKIFLEIYFFIRLKVYNNFYSLVLFLFLFIYQFTGSFLINVAEIGGWMFVFNSKFVRFNINRLKDNLS